MANEEIKNFIDNADRLDLAAGDEGYVLPLTKRYDIRSLLRYCKENGIEPSALTEKEIKQFER